MADKLYEHVSLSYQPRNVNLIHQMEQEIAGVNGKIALGLTKAVGTMACAYLFTVLAVIGFPGFGATPAQYVQWTSQTLIQLVMLSVIMVGQSILGRHQELQAEEQYNTTIKTAHEIDQIVQHMEAQDSVLQHILFLIAKEQLPSKDTAMSLTETAIVAPEHITNETVNE